MFLTGDSTFARSASRTITVVAIAVLGSLTVCRRCSRGSATGRSGWRPVRRPTPGRRREPGLVAIVDRVLRRPLLSVVSPAACMLALAVPALQLRMTARARDVPHRDPFPAVQAYGGCSTRPRDGALRRHHRRGAEVKARLPFRCDPPLEQRAPASGACTSRSPSTSIGHGPMRTLDPDRRQNDQTVESDAVLPGLRDRIVPGPSVAPERGPASPARGPVEGLHRRPEVEPPPVVASCS